MLAAGICLITFALPAHALEFGARGYYWWPDFSADLRVDNNSIVGTDVSAKDDLGISDESYPSVEAFVKIGDHMISLMYTKASYSGAQNISRPITFNGQTYAVSDFVQSDLDFTMVDLEYQYDVLDLENILAGFSLGVIGKVKYIEGEARLRDITAGIDEQEDFKAPVPMVGLGAHVGILADILEARAKVAGIGYSGNMFYEALADVSWTPFPFLDIHGGYKLMKLEVDDISDVYADFEFNGPYIALTVSY